MGKVLVQAQQASDERLFMLESEVKRSSEEYNVISSKPKHKFNKKIYGDQYEFNVKISAILRKALSSRDELDKQTHINEGIELINKRNKLLVLADAHGWEVAEAYNADPLADDNTDEKKIRKAKKREKYHGIKSSKMLECLEQETEHRRNRCRTFKDLTPMDRPQFSPPLIQSVQISPVGAAIVQATTQGFARPLYLLGPTVFPAPPPPQPGNFPNPQRI